MSGQGFGGLLSGSDNKDDKNHASGDSAGMGGSSYHTWGSGSYSGFDDHFPKYGSVGGNQGGSKQSGGDKKKEEEANKKNDEE